MFACFRYKLFSWQRLSHYIFLVGIALFLLSGISRAESANLAWDAPTGSSPVGYKVYYGTSSRNYGAPVDAKNVTSYAVPNLTAGTTYYFAVTAYDATGNQSGYSNEVSATISVALAVDFTGNQTSLAPGQLVTFTPSVTPSTATIASWNWDIGNGTTSSAQIPTTSYATSGTYSVILTAKDSTGNIATKTKAITVAAPAPVANFTASTTGLTATFTDTSTGTITSRSWSFGDGTSSTAQNPSHTYGAGGTYAVTLTVTGDGGSNTKTNSITVSSSSVSDSTQTPVKGLVAAYGFNEATTSTTVVDASGLGNNGAITGTATRATGRFGTGGALKFNGSTWVTIKDSVSLDLSTAMTLEAWIYPTVWMSKGNTVLAKEDGTSNTVYYLYANEDTNLPLFGARINSSYRAVTALQQLPPNQWVHVAGTYDGQYFRLYINGQMVAIQQQTNTIPASSGVLRMGGNKIWREYFNGLLDDVRIYNRALSQDEIIADSNKSVN